MTGYFEPDGVRELRSSVLLSICLRGASKLCLLRSVKVMRRKRRRKRKRTRPPNCFVVVTVL